jgi:hypothetical protein
MPTNRTYRTRKHRAAVEQWQRDILLDVRPYDPGNLDEICFAEFMPDSFEESAVGIWNAMRDELLAEFIADNPGKRPQMWWERDAPKEPRRRTESQASYLKRHGLFLPGEEKRLKPKDFRPEAVTAPSEDEAA